MGMSAMELKLTERGPVSVVTMIGDLELQEIEDFKSVMDRVLSREGPPKAVLDLARVTRLTSYVVAMVGFYNAHFRQSGGTLVVAGAPSAALRSFELSGLASVLDLADSVEAALKRLGA